MITKKALTFSVSLVAGISTFLSSTPALAAVPANCTSYAYACTLFGYAGKDPYGYWAFGAQDKAGRWHNCTSYAAYVVSIISPYDAQYKKLGLAKYWAVRAPGLGLQVSKSPEILSIAQWDYGHVAVVEDIGYNSRGQVTYVVTSSDNYSENPVKLVTTRHVYYRSDANYPDNFIVFPAWAGGGGTPPVAMISVP
jgi:hypothetical protein